MAIVTRAKQDFSGEKKNPKTQQNLMQIKLKLRVRLHLAFLRGLLSLLFPRCLCANSSRWHSPGRGQGPGAVGRQDPSHPCTEGFKGTATELSSHLLYLPPATWKPFGKQPLSLGSSFLWVRLHCSLRRRILVRRDRNQSLGLPLPFGLLPKLQLWCCSSVPISLHKRPASAGDS